MPPYRQSLLWTILTAGAFIKAVVEKTPSSIRKLGLLNNLKMIDWGSFLGNAQKTLGVINQAIPIVYQVKPIIKNAKTIFKIANSLKETNVKQEKQNIARAISSSVVLGANELDCKAILVATNEGKTARRISMLKPPCPIIAAAESEEVVKSLEIYFGVLPIIATGRTIEEITENAKEIIKEELNLKSGDRIIVTGGFPFKKVNHTNFMEIIEI